MAVRDRAPKVGERGLFAPALLVARPALTGFVPLTRLIVGSTSCESTRRGHRSGRLHWGRRGNLFVDPVEDEEWCNGIRGLRRASKRRMIVNA